MEEVIVGVVDKDVTNNHIMAKKYHLRLVGNNSRIRVSYNPARNHLNS